MVPETTSTLTHRHWPRTRTLAMYDVHEDTSSNDHTYLENAATSLNPPVVLEDISHGAI